MKKIQTQEDVDFYKSSEYKRFLNILGGNIVLEKPIRFRETPHTPTKYIYELDINDNFNDYGLARDTILQVLRGLVNKKELQDLK